MTSCSHAQADWKAEPKAGGGPAGAAPLPLSPLRSASAPSGGGGRWWWGAGGSADGAGGSAEAEAEAEVEAQAEAEAAEPLADVLERGEVRCGMIDVLEAWSTRWEVQRFVLKYALRFGCGITGNPRGTTACRPRSYALRFEEFLQSEVLRLRMGQRDPLAPTYRPWR